MNMIRKWLSQNKNKKKENFESKSQQKRKLSKMREKKFIKVAGKLS